MNRLWKFVAGSVLVTAAAFSTSAMAEGTLRYATIGEPPSLDIQVGTATIASTIAQHMFETLYAFDADYKPQPLLASGDSVECIAPGSLDTSLSHAAGLSDIAVCHA